jgi:hypothetical protein
LWPYFQWLKGGQAIEHIAFFGASGRVHADGGFVPHPCLGVHVTGHMQGMTPAGRDLAIAAATVERLFGLMVIPVVNAVMVSARMVRLFGENLANHRRPGT